MVDSIVKEQYLCRFHEYRYQRQQAVSDQEINSCREHGEDCCHNRSDQIVSDDRQDHSDDTDREIVDQHFKSGRNTPLCRFVKLLDDPSGKRTHSHGSHEHDLIASADHTEDSNDRNDSAAFAGDEFSSLITDQHRKDVLQHRIDHSCKFRIREPALFNEQGCDKAPGNECADIRHDHCT